MCDFLLNIILVGAVQTQPGFIEVEYLHKDSIYLPGTEIQIETINIPVDEYLDCYYPASMAE